MSRYGVRFGSLLCSLICCLGVVAMLVNSASAAIITGESVTASTVRGDGGFAPNFSAIHAVDDSGLSGGLHDVNNSAHSWLSHNANVEGTDTDPWLRIDLGAVYDITSFHVWNFNENFGNAANGLQNVDIYYSTSNASVGTGDTSLGSYVFQSRDDSIVDGAFNISGQDFSQSFTARYIYLDINSNYGGACFGLSEIQFTGTPIPEPSSLMLVAIGGVLMLCRRFRSVLAS